MSSLSALLTSLSMTRIYACADTSGSLADTSGNSKNATVAGGSPTYSQTNFLNGDSGNAVNLNGGWFSIPTTGFATGVLTGGISWGVFCKVGTVPSSFKGLIVYGTEVASQSLQLGLDSGGHPFAGLKSVSSATGTTPTAGTIHLYGLDFTGGTGGTLKLFDNGVSAGTPVTVTPAIVATAMMLNAFSDGSSHLAGNWLIKFAFVGPHLTDAQWAQIYAYGQDLIAGVALTGAGSSASSAAFAGAAPLVGAGRSTFAAAFAGAAALTGAGRVSPSAAYGGRTSLSGSGSTFAAPAYGGSVAFGGKGSTTARTAFACNALLAGASSAALRGGYAARVTLLGVGGASAHARYKPLTKGVATISAGTRAVGTTSATALDDGEEAAA